MFKNPFDDHLVCAGGESRGRPAGQRRVAPARKTSGSSILSAPDSIPASTVAVLAALLTPVRSRTVTAPAISAHSPTRSGEHRSGQQPPCDTRVGSSKLCATAQNA